MNKQKLKKILAENSKEVAEILQELQTEKKVEKLKWRCDRLLKGKYYYRIDSTGDIYTIFENYNIFDDYRYKTGNYNTDRRVIEVYKEYINRNPLYLFARAVYQHIIERDYMSTGSDKYYVYLDSRGVVEVGQGGVLMGVQYSTARPDIDAIKEEMGEELWEAWCKGVMV